MKQTLQVVIDYSQFHSQLEVHKYIKEQLHFPDYYGNNLDALHDCLLGLSYHVIVKLENEDNELLYDFAKKIRQVIDDAVMEGANIQVL